MKFCSVFWFLFAFLSLARVPAMDGLPEYGLLLEMEEAFAGHRRNLQEDRACNEIIEVFPKEAVRILGERLTAAFLADNPALIDQAQAILLGAIQYDIAVVKVCHSCEETDIAYPDADFQTSGDGFGSYQSYCGQDVYGYDARHSSLLFYPVTDNEDALPGKYQGLLYLHGLRFNPLSVPTNEYPENFASLVGTGDIETLIFWGRDFLEVILGSSAGLVSIMPDNIGHGNTAGTHNRTGPYVHEFIMQGAVQGIMGVKAYLKEKEPCSKLAGSWTVVGNSDGGFSAPPVAQSVRLLGDQVDSVYTNAAYLDVQYQNRFVFESLALGKINETLANFLMLPAAPLGAAVASFETPGFLNTGTGQLHLNEEYFDAVVNLTRSPNVAGAIDILEVVPEVTTESWHPGLQALFQTAAERGIGRPCNNASLVTDDIDKLCDVMKAGTILDMLPSFDIPTQLCFSPDDSLVDARQYEEDVFTDTVTKISSLLGGLLTVEGDHLSAILTCKLAPVAFFATTPTATAIASLTSEELQMCSPVMSTSAPTMSPVMTMTSSGVKYQSWLHLLLSVIF